MFLRAEVDGTKVPFCLAEGAVGILLAPRGRLGRVLRFEVTDGKIRAVEIIVKPEPLRALAIATLEG